MTSLDPSHLPTGQRHAHPSRGQALYRRPGASGKLGLPIPDLRFEQSYLLSLRRFIHEAPEEHPAFNGNEKLSNTHRRTEKAVDIAGLTSGTEASTVYGLPLRVDWGWILYVTTRDQVLSPFAQGAIWAIASLFLRPFLRTLGARVRIHFWRTWQSIFPPIEPHVQGGAGWMRKQLREFTVGGVGTNIALAK